jgi:hypothetical protein
MRVKLRTIYASPQFTADAGAVIELPDKEGDELVLRGYAVEIQEKAPQSEPGKVEGEDQAPKKPKAKGK